MTKIKIDIYDEEFVKGLFNRMSTTYDLMSGMGECWNLINRKAVRKHRLLGVDISEEMNNKAHDNMNEYASLNIDIIQANVLENSIKPNSTDYIVSSFGLKTFSKSQLKRLASEVKRILKPNGQFSFVEISKPKNLLLKIPYMIYLKLLIPLIGKVFMGNSEDYRMLGIYCEHFKDCSTFRDFLIDEGLEVKQQYYFFGCASGVVGRKVSYMSKL